MSFMAGLELVHICDPSSCLGMPPIALKNSEKVSSMMNLCATEEASTVDHEVSLARPCASGCDRERSRGASCVLGSRAVLRFCSSDKDQSQLAPTEFSSRTDKVDLVWPD